MAAKEREKKLIEIRPLDIQRVDIRIIGDTPLIVHAWSDKAKKMMIDNQTGATKTKAKEKKDPFDDFVQSLYWLEGKPKASTPEAFNDALKNGAKFGFPVGAIKQAGNSAAYRLKWVDNQMALRGTYFLIADYNDFFEVKGSAPEIREDMVRVGQGKADVRYRAEFKNWYADMTLEYNASGAITLEQIFNIISAGGYTAGIGEWRPERDGTFGRFHIEAV